MDNKLARPRPPAVELEDKEIEVLADLLANGYYPHQIANRVAKGDKKVAKAVRNRIRRKIRNDPALQGQLAARSMGHFFERLGPMTKAIIDRTERTGRPDGMKFLAEMYGVYSSKHSHQHSGEVKITLQGVPRPEAIIDEPVDAEIVED